ncbi:MAG: TetR/AcrR family transcriptional regulator [Lachnospiraceae bacterium]
MSIETFNNLPEGKKSLIISTGIEVFSKASFSDASTDLITQKAGISKGLLFHYFGSKKNFYLYLLENSLDLFSRPNMGYNAKEGDKFYDILFKNMDRKLELEVKYHKEMLFINMASKETSKHVAAEKTEIVKKYMAEVQKNSAITINKAISTLLLRADVDKEKLVKGLSMYINTIILQYLQIYRECPQDFFDNSENIKSEIKGYIDLMLHGVEVKEDD